MRLLALTPPAVRAALDEGARRAGYEPTVATSLHEMLRMLREEEWAATLMSLSVDGVDEAVARRVGAERTAGALILTARRVPLSTALLGQRVGALAVLREPIPIDELAARLAEIADEGAAVPVAVGSEHGEPGMLIGDSPAMSEVFETIARVAGSDVTVLISGESGTGKEVVARALHVASPRAERPFVAVNCAAIPEQLLESELFGHERGAFTGATGKRIGRIERASGGTLFLDEIGDMSLPLQAKLLRVLEERSVERLGGDAPTSVDVRAIAATNVDVSAAIAAGRFREDLYYRLAVVEVVVPPLRERRGDVRALALHFAAHFARRHDRPIRAISERALARLEAYAWPGNVRELRNVMDRAVLFDRGEVIRSSALRLGPASPHAGPRTSPATEAYPTNASLAEVESDHIARVLAATGGHVTRAADILGIHRNTLTRKVRDYGIEVGEGVAS